MIKNGNIKYKKLRNTKRFSHFTHTGCFIHWYPPKKLKYGKPRLSESMLT